MLGSFGGCLLLAAPAAYRQPWPTRSAQPTQRSSTRGTARILLCRRAIRFRSSRPASISRPVSPSARPDQDGKFEVYVLELGHGLPSAPCNEQDSFGSGQFDPTNPFTPDILVFDEVRQADPRSVGKAYCQGGLQAAGPAVDLAFEQGLKGGRLFASRLQSGHPCGRAEQQLPYRGGGSRQRTRYTVHHQSADWRSSH